MLVNRMNLARAKRCRFAGTVSVALVAGLTIFASRSVAQVEYVDPTIGNVGILLVPTRPAVYLPNSMVRVYPIRADALDDQIASFPLTISSHRMDELFSIMPGEHGGPAAYDQEKTTPYYYSVRFDESLIQTEFSPTERCGYFRFTFPHGNASVELVKSPDWQPSDSRGRCCSRRRAVQQYEGVCVWRIQRARHFQVRDERRPKQRDRCEPRRPGRSSFAMAFLSSALNRRRRTCGERFPRGDLIASRMPRRRVGTRPLDRSPWKEARKRSAEFSTPRFIAVSNAWSTSPKMADITADSIIKVHEDARPFYVDNWLWDTYRALEPLQTLLDPGKEADKIQSYVRMYQQSGIMPTFAIVSGNYACMNGNHSAPWFADAWFKGVRNFDVETAYEGVRKRSLDVTMLPWRLGPRGPLDEFYAAHGYMPALRPGEKETDPQVHPFEKRQPVPVTLENSFDDWNIAQLARVLNKPDDEKLFLHRAANYKNVFRVDKGLAWPKDADGKWIEPLDPKFGGGMGGRDYYDENNGYTYTWDVMQDVNGLADLMGGTDKAQANLDQLFREPLGRSKYEFQAKFPDSTSMAGQFSMGNEPSLAIPYIYDRLGAPWKTQKRVRMLLESFFTDTLQGIPGDEDGGGMSAFVVFSMLGFYPATVGIPVYDVGSPVFDKATIHLKNGKDFVIVADHNSHENKYVQSIRLNGQPLNQVWFRHSDIVGGGTLELIMGDVPNTTLGSTASAFPPDSLTVHPEDYASRLR